MPTISSSPLSPLYSKMSPGEEFQFTSTSDWQECTTCHSIRALFNSHSENITTSQIRRSSERAPGCSFCSLLLTGLEIFGLENDIRVVTICIERNKEGWEMRAIGDGELGTHVEKLQFHNPGGEVHLPITDFKAERHFMEYGGEKSMGRVRKLVGECNTLHACLAKKIETS